MDHPENDSQYQGLKVETSPENPGIVNPYLKLRPRARKRELGVSDFVEGIRRGDVTILSRAVTLLESTRPEHEAMAQEVPPLCRQQCAYRHQRCARRRQEHQHR